MQNSFCCNDISTHFFCGKSTTFSFFPTHRCGCDECVTSQESDSLRHSQSRINAYRALSASSLIALSSRDPVLTAFELAWELKRLQTMESEFRAEYGVKYVKPIHKNWNF